MFKKIFEKILHAPKPSDGMFDEVGAIKLDPTPLVQVVPSAAGGGSMREMLESYFASERAKALADQLGVETYDEALDFGDETEDDFPGSPYSVDDERSVFEANQRIRDAISEASIPHDQQDPAPSRASSKKKVAPQGDLPPDGGPSDEEA